MDTVQTEDDARQRILQVMRFLAEVARRRSPVARRWTELPWTLDLSTLPEHPAVRVGGEAEDGVVLSIKRPGETPCEPPPPQIAGWILPGWAVPEDDARVHTSQNRVEGEETVTVRFDDDPERVAAFERWTQRRARWAEAERPVRRVATLFQRVFELRGRMERESERLVLYAGDGMLRWHHPDGTVERPLLLHRLELHFEPRTPSFELRYTDDPIEMETTLLRELGADGRVLGEMRDRLSGSEFGLLEEGATDFIAEMIHRLFPDGFFADAVPVAITDHPTCCRQPVVMLAPRSGGIVTAIDGFVERLNGQSEIPEPLRSVVLGDPGDLPGDPGPGAYENDPGEPGDDADDDSPPSGPPPPRRAPIDLLLTKPANPEQEAVVRALARSGKVVVQGPPGTGKSHTIANLIGHLLAEGKSVLVTSHSTKALKVLRQHIAGDLRPLCVAVLDHDSEDRRLLESSVNGIVEGLQTPKADRAAEAERSQRAREKLRAELRDRERELERAIRDEYDAIVIGGEEYQPSAAARRAREERTSHDWLPGPLERGVVCPLDDAEVRDLYRLNARVIPGDESILAGGLPAPSDVFAPDELERVLIAGAEARERSVDTHPGLWDDNTPRSAEDLRRASELATAEFRRIRSATALSRECMDCGRLGGTRREPWDDLISTVERLAARIDEHHAVVVKHAPAFGARRPGPAAQATLDRIIEHMGSRDTLSHWSRFLHPSWSAIVRSASVNGVAPRTRADFAALGSLLALGRDRDQLLRRWASQVGILAPRTHGDLGALPEDAARQHLPALRRDLGWHSGEWGVLERRLAELGFNLSRATELVPPRTGPGGELHRWSDVIEKFVSPALGARTHLAEARNLQARLDGVGQRLGACGDGTIGAELAAALRARDTGAYARCFSRLAELRVRLDDFEHRERLLARLAPCAPRWAEAVRGREDGHDRDAPPTDAAAAWRWRQLEQELARRASTDINILERSCSETKDRLRDETERYVVARVWERQHERAKGSVRSALISWLQTVTARGYQRGVRAARLKKEARKLLNEARAAVPVWIMPLARVVESYDFRETRFDVVILDEASQCDMTGLVALGIADSAVIVGDDKQVSPTSFERLEESQTLIDEYLDGVLSKHLYTGRLSMYDLATAGFGHTVRLLEHFRCVNEIIQFSNTLSYDGTIRPLRESSTVATRPFVVSHRVSRGEREGKINEQEAKQLVSLVAAMLREPEYTGKSFGVISMLGEEQALLIDRMLREHISESEYAERGILCGTPPQFQGDERDIVLLSLVDHAPGGPLRLRADDDSKKRYNVAASRARDQLWVVHSLNRETDLKQDDLRARLLTHAEDPLAADRQLQEQTGRVESEFERLVLKSLTGSGYKVVTQWRVGGFRIDMVVFGADGARVALECDGDRFHPPENLAHDIDRQRILERLGWRFVRIRGSAYFRDPDGTMSLVRRRMTELGVEAIGPDAAASTDGAPDELRGRVTRRAEELRRAWADAESEGEGEEMDDAMEFAIAPGANGHEADEQGVASEAAPAPHSRTAVLNHRAAPNDNNAARAVLAAIREAGVPIARGEAMYRSGVSHTEWTAAIQILVSRGDVIRTGAKRGSRYTVAPTETDDVSLFQPD